jgi:hypothetical protein
MPKKKEDCDIKDLEAKIKEILNIPVSEVDDDGRGRTVQDLEDILCKDFEFTHPELCKALSNLCFHLEIRLKLESSTLINDNSEEKDCVVGEIYLGPGMKDVEEEEEEK